MREVDLGDRFLLSMLHWCGVGKRSTPLDYWQVYLIRQSAITVGVCGLYRQIGMEKTVLWLGWLGIRLHFRRQGVAKKTVPRLVSLAQKQGAKELWVYTDAANEPAQQLYEKLNFERMGTAEQCAPGKTMNDSDIVFRRLI